MRIVVKVVLIRCDYPECIHDYRQESNNVSTTVKGASELGWEFRDNREYCPKHKGKVSDR